MRPSHYYLIIATIGWMAVALIWAVDTFYYDISGAPIGLVYLAAFGISAAVCGLIFMEVQNFVSHAEFGAIRLPNPRSALRNLRSALNRHAQMRKSEKTNKRRRRKRL